MTDPEDLIRRFGLTEVASYPAGDYVECDMGGEVLTADPRSGGFLFGSKAVGPCCAERVEASARHNGELDYIRARCPEGVSFADWVRRLRGPDAAVRIFTGGDGNG